MKIHAMVGGKKAYQFLVEHGFEVSFAEQAGKENLIITNNKL